MRAWILVTVMVVVIAGTLLKPSAALASDSGQPCPNTKGQYYTPLIPFYNTRTQQMTLVDPKTYRPVQIMADSVKRAYLLDNYSYESAWSPSCRYYVFGLYVETGLDTVIWDTLQQKVFSTFHLEGLRDAPRLDWSNSDDYLVAGNYQGEYLWKTQSNQQIQLNNYPSVGFWTHYTWDIPHGQTLMFDETYVVAIDLNTGKTIHKYISPFESGEYSPPTHFEISPDGRNLRIWEPVLNDWSVTYDRASGRVIDANAINDLPADQVKFSPDHRYLAIGGWGVRIYDTNDALTPTNDGWWPIMWLNAGYYTWHFVDSSTLELDYTKIHKREVYDLKKRQLR